MLNVVKQMKDLKSALLADSKRFYTVDTGAWVTGLPKAHELRLATGREPLWINLGYWRDVERVDENNCERAGELTQAAQRQMAHLIAKTARMGEGDKVLDCGFGYADQDIIWAEEYRPAQIVGVNITPIQVQLGRERVRLTGLEKRVRLEEGSATALPFGAGEFDLVVALESAMHFRTRRDFLREAFRVLRPRGRLVMVDMAQKTDREASAGMLGRLRHRYWRGMIAIPETNVWTTPRFRSELAEVGFQGVKVESIEADVYPGADTAFVALGGLRDLSRQPGQMSMDKVREKVRQARETAPEQRQWPALFNHDDYLLVYAEKP